VTTGLPSQTQVIELLDGEFARAGYEIEDVVIDARTRPPRIMVIADGDNGLDLDTAATLSRSASALLDGLDSIGDHYVLEVSSPGVGRPLTEPRHWHRARGRMVKVNVIQGDNITGRIQSVDDGGVTLVPEVAVKKGMKPRQGEPVKLPFDRIRNGKVEIEFSHLPEDGLEPEHNGPSEEA